MDKNITGSVSREYYPDRTIFDSLCVCGSDSHLPRTQICIIPFFALKNFSESKLIMNLLVYEQ